MGKKSSSTSRDKNENKISRRSNSGIRAERPFSSINANKELKSIHQSKQSTANRVSSSQSTFKNSSQGSSCRLEPVPNQVYSTYEDNTDHENDEQEQLLNQKFKNNNKKSKYPPVRQHYDIQTAVKNKVKCICKLFFEIIGISSGSDSNLRTHLAYKHDMLDVLTESQLKRFKSSSEVFNKEKIPLEEKLKLHEEVVDCIINDSRTFNDLKKKE
jgi:hypothetical protein